MKDRAWQRSVLLALGVCLLIAPVPARAQGPAPVPQSFRTEVELIPVDVHVLDRDGRPVPGLGQDKFTVTINGRRRRIVSTTYVDASGPVAAPPSATSTSVPAQTAPMPESRRRLFVLAVDVSSFDESAGRAVLRRAAEFVRQLRPQDEIGLFAYPVGPKIEITTDHDAVIRAIDTIMTRRETPALARLNLSLSDIIDVSRGGAHAQAVIDRECLNAEFPELCAATVISDALGAVVVYEALAQTSIMPIVALMNELGRIPERKTVVLVSGGLPSGDVGGRPDHSMLGFEAGRAAARNNVNLYTLFLDQQLWASLVTAENSRPALNANPGRDTAILGRWLAEFSGRAGGSMLNVGAGDGSRAFDRVLTETSGYYLLGVEPADEDRDGRAYELRVSVDARDVTVRGRSWVVVPKPGEARVAAAGAPAAPTEPSKALPPPPPGVKALADAFDRDDRQALAAALAPRNADTLLDAFRVSESPWPASPRRTAAFALELALIGAGSDSPFTKDAATRLLVEYAIRVRQPATDDPFECTWLWTAIAGVQGLMATQAGIVLAERAVDRCPANASLRLARAVVRDQQLFELGVSSALRRGPAVPPVDLERQVLDLYEAAAAAPDTRFEARVRAAAVHWRAGRHDAGLVEIAKRGAAPGDPLMAYLADIVQGQLLLGIGNPRDAIVVFRRALEKRPDAQSARVSLASALVATGQLAEAAALASRIVAEAPTRADPWWTLPFGDSRALGFIRSRLLEMVR